MRRRLNHAFAACILLGLTSTAPAFSDAEDRALGHHAANGFRNPYAKPRDGDFFDVLYSRLLTDEWPSYDLERDLDRTSHGAHTAENECQIPG